MRVFVPVGRASLGLKEIPVNCSRDPRAFAWKVVRQHDDYTYFENAVTGRRSCSIRVIVIDQKYRPCDPHLSFPHSRCYLRPRVWKSTNSPGRKSSVFIGLPCRMRSLPGCGPATTSPQRIPPKGVGRAFRILHASFSQSEGHVVYIAERDRSRNFAGVSPVQRLKARTSAAGSV